MLSRARNFLKINLNPGLVLGIGLCGNKRAEPLEIAPDLARSLSDMNPGPAQGPRSEPGSGPRGLLTATNQTHGQQLGIDALYGQIRHLFRTSGHLFSIYYCIEFGSSISNSVPICYLFGCPLRWGSIAPAQPYLSTFTFLAPPAAFLFGMKGLPEAP